MNDMCRNWASFTYTAKQTARITKPFKNTEMKIIYKTNNTTGKFLKTNNQQQG
jgi:hypothetical protein